MAKLDKIKDILSNGNIELLDKYNQNTLCNTFIEILEQEMNEFDYDSDIDYLDNLIKQLPKYMKKNLKTMDERLKIIYQKIKTYVVQKPGNIEKTNHNYKLLKKLLDDIVLIRISILYDYIDEFDGSLYEIINYIIVDLKSISIFKDAAKKFPYMVNFFDESNKRLIVSVIEKYIDKVMNYETEEDIDEITYYDEIINTILTSPKFIFDIVDKQTMLKKIKEKLKEIEHNKYAKIFYLNALTEKIQGKEEPQDATYYEYKFNIPTIFNEAINSEVRKIINNYSIEKGRTIIDDYILSFDGEDAKEIDDALSAKILDNNHLLLGVHIADPLAIIDTDSIIFDEAAKRTTSIYLSDKTISMYPKELAEDLLSLNEGNYRPAISYYFEFDENGNLVNEKFIKSVIKVDRNMTYNDFNHISAMNSNDKLKKNVTNLQIASNILQKYYNEDPLYEKVNRTEKNISNTNIIGMTNGEKVIESTMIYTNYRVATYFKEKGLPYGFRNHVISVEMQKKLQNIKQYILKQAHNEEYLRYIEILNNIYPKAEYDVVSKGHFGLGIPTYGHITAPDRRHGDNVNISCLYKFYFDEYDESDITKYTEFVKKHVKHINARRTPIERFAAKYENLTAK